VKRTAILIAALAGVLLAFHAQAQEPGQGFFGFSYGVVNTDGASPYNDTIDEGTAAGFKIYGGKMFDNRFGMEFAYYDLGKYDVSTAAGVRIAESKTSAVTVAGVLATPLGGGYSFHAKAGIAFTQFQISCVTGCGLGSPALIDTKKRGVSGLLGLGIGAQLAHNLTMRIDYDHFGTVHHQLSTLPYKSPYDILSVSVQFSF
jgi:OmpA-like transmembrane domain